MAAATKKLYYGIELEVDVNNVSLTDEQVKQYCTEFKIDNDFDACKEYSADNLKILRYLKDKINHMKILQLTIKGHDRIGSEYPATPLGRRTHKLLEQQLHYGMMVNVTVKNVVLTKDEMERYCRIKNCKLTEFTERVERELANQRYRTLLGQSLKDKRVCSMIVIGDNKIGPQFPVVPASEPFYYGAELDIKVTNVSLTDAQVKQYCKQYSIDSDFDDIRDNFTDNLKVLGPLRDKTKKFNILYRSVVKQSIGENNPVVPLEGYEGETSESDQLYYGAKVDITMRNIKLTESQAKIFTVVNPRDPNVPANFTEGVDCYPFNKQRLISIGCGLKRYRVVCMIVNGDNKIGSQFPADLIDYPEDYPHYRVCELY